LIVVAFFVFMAAAQESGAVQMQSVIRGLNVSAAMVTEFKALPRNASLGEAADVLLHTSQHEFPVVDPDGTLRGIFTRAELVAAQAVAAQPRTGSSRRWHASAAVSCEETSVMRSLRNPDFARSAVSAELSVTTPAARERFAAMIFRVPALARRGSASSWSASV